MKKLILIIFAIIPVSARTRGRLYRLYAKFQKNSSVGKNFRIGWGSYIDSQMTIIGNNSLVGNLVRVKYLDEFKVGDHFSIGSSTIICGAKNEKKVLTRLFSCGNDVEILCSHYFDIVAPVYIGNKVIIGGKLTQFYTHSFDLDGCRMDGSISIGSNVYIGAGCLINPGISICDKVVLQGGTVVNRSINESGVYTSNKFYKRGLVRSYRNLFGEECRMVSKDGTDSFVHSYD